MPPNYYKIGFLLFSLSALDAFAAPLITAATLYAATQVFGLEFTQPYLLLAILAALLSYTLVRQESLQHGVFMSGWALATRAGFAWLAVVALLLLIGYATKVSSSYSRGVLFLWVGAAAPLLMAAPVLLRQCFRRLAVAAGNSRSIAIAGVNPMSRELGRIVDERPELGLSTEGFFDDRHGVRLGHLGRDGLAGTLRDLPAVARKRDLDMVFIALPYHLERTKALLRELRSTSASVYLIPDISFVDLIQARADDVSGVPIIALCETPFQGWAGFKKRATDVALASLMLIGALPVMLLIALAIKLTSPGNVIFKQRRYGLDGEEIIVYKFRTMTVSEDGEHVRQATRNDSRVTPVGRWLRRYSLDELPQLFNVLQGRMSLVGPRPHAVAHNEQYRKLIPGYMVRHKVAPGITGLAQVNGCRGETAELSEMQRRIDYDLDYLRHWSLALDLRILFRTALILFRSEKAY